MLSRPGLEQPDAPRSFSLPADLPGPGVGCTVGKPDAEIAVALDVEEWASLLATVTARHSGSERTGKLPAHVLVTDQPVERTDHAVVVHVRPDGAAVALDPGLFTEATRQRFVRDVKALAGGADPLDLEGLPTVTVDRARSIVPGAEERRAEPNWGDCVIRRLLAVAEQNPDDVALIAGDRTLSYSELTAWVGGLAERIGESASRPLRIGVLAGHGAEAVAGVLSALAAGASYVPLDPQLPDGRLRRIIRQVRPDVQLYAPALRQRAESLLHRGARALAIEPCSAPLRPPPRTDDATPLAYVLFTSGTTGTPKGVCQTTPGLMRQARAYRDSVALAAGETVPLLASLAFDAAVMDLYGGLLTGATVHVVNPLQSAPDLRTALALRPPAVLHATPTLLRHLLQGVDLPWPELAGVRAVVFGGERLSAADVEAVRAALPVATVVNGLGPSECTVAIQHVIAPDEPVDAVVPVGLAVPGVRVDLQGPDGISGALAGELVLTGPGVATGYLGQEELTHQHFHDNGDGTRSYRTGDRAWWRPDGALVFLGRADRQIQVRGQRVEPQEVEATLQAHPTVAQAAVTLDREGRLVAYVTPATAFRPVADDLLRFAARQLPAAAIPTRVVTVDTMPMGPTGKRDLAALVDLPDGEARTEADFSPGQQRVAGIWARLLGHDRFLATDDFLLVGGDSLLMTQLSLALEDEFGVALDLIDVMTGCTVAELTALCERLSNEEMTA